MPPEYSNTFLQSLSPANQTRMAVQLEKVHLPVGTFLYEAVSTPEYAYFLTSGFASQVISIDRTEGVEVGIIGREGVVGSLSLLGPALSPQVCFMQSSGAGLRIPFKNLRTMFMDSEDMRDRILAHIQVQSVTASCLTACNKLHPAEARLARWLLMVQDRLQTDVLPLKQEFLAQMLGLRRMTVVAAAGALHAREIISYKRGNIRVLDRKMLEVAACECYGIIRTAYGHLAH